MQRLLMLLCQKADGTGSGTVTREVARRLAARGLDVTVLCGAAVTDRADSWFGDPRVHVRTVRFGDGTALPFPVVGMSNEMPYAATRFAALDVAMLARYEQAWTAAIQTAVRDTNPDVIHIHHLWLLVRFVCRVAADLPTVVSIHGTDLQRAEELPRLRELIADDVREVDRILALTRRTANLSRALYGLSGERVSILANGVDELLFAPARAPGPLSGGEQSPPGRQLVLFVAKFAPWKGLAYLLEALTVLRAWLTPTPLLWVLGTGPGAEVDAVRRQIAELGLDDDVALLGHRSSWDVATAMRMAHVFVLPSFDEPFGLVLLEAMASGCRVVAADQGGPRELIPRAACEQGDAGLVAGLERFPPSEADARRYVGALARAIAEQLAAPLDHADRERIAGRVTNLSWTSHVDALLRTYDEIAASRPRGGSRS